MLITRMIRNRTAVISLMALGLMPANMATATHALYKMDPTTTLLVTRKNVTFLNRLVPMITLARPMTTAPVPIEISKLLCCCA